MTAPAFSSPRVGIEQATASLTPMATAYATPTKSPAAPDNGAWDGPGVFAGFAGYFFDPAEAGLGPPRGA